MVMRKTVIGLLIVLVMAMSVFAMGNQTDSWDGSGKFMSKGKSITYYLSPGSQVINQKIYYAPGSKMNKYYHKKMWLSGKYSKYGKKSKYGHYSKYGKSSRGNRIFWFGKKLILLGLAIALIIFVWKRVKKQSKRSKRRK